MYEKWLRSFHAVAREGGFTAASQVLNVGQPTITEQVRNLEDTFGVELFHRHGRVIELTEMGRELLEVTQDIFGHTEEAVNLLRTAKEHRIGRFRIGATNPYGLMALVTVFQGQFPDIEVAATVQHRPEIMRQLLDFEIDAAVIGLPATDKRFHNVSYHHHRVRLLVKEDHPWARRRAIPIKELKDQPMILREAESSTRQAFERAARAAGASYQTVLEINNREAIREAVSLGMGFGLASEAECFLPAGLKAVPISDSDVTIAFHGTCLASRKARPLIKAFLELVAERAGEGKKAA